MSDDGRGEVLERLLGGPAEGATSTWSAAPRGRGAGVGELLRHAVARELRVGLHRLEAAQGAETRVVRVPGPGHRSPALAWLRGGVVASVTRDGSTTVLDELLAEARLTTPEAVAVGRDGSVLLHARARDGAPVVVRVGAGPGDPHPAAAVLRRMDLQDAAIPRIVDVGTTAGLGWTVETRLPGRRPDALTEAIVDDVGELLLRLPGDGAPPTSWEEDLTTLAERAPEARAAVSSLVHDLRPVLARVPSVVRHGDLWRGNLLVQDGRLSGVVDWDAAHTCAPPGVDLLQLLTTERRGRGRGLGEVFRARPWRDRRIRGPVAGHLDRRGVRADDRLLEALAVCWWAQEIAGTVRRLPMRAADHGWWEPNVRAVLRALAVDRAG